MDGQVGVGQIVRTAEQHGNFQLFDGSGQLFRRLANLLGKFSILIPSDFVNQFDKGIEIVYFALKVRQAVHHAFQFLDLRQGFPGNGLVSPKTGLHRAGLQFRNLRLLAFDVKDTSKGNRHAY